MAKFGNKTRLISMMIVTSLFFLAEIITGYFTTSMALVADSFHMLSDVLSIVIGFLALHYSEKKSKRNTYNWARAEVLGAMANAVFLLALVFTIIVGAMQRIIVIEEVTQPLLILGVGGAGLAINIFGLIIFGGHAHGHSHHHGHDHGDHHSDDFHRQDNLSDAVAAKNPDATHKHASSQMNMQAVFLHVLGDALGSLVVIISALVIYFVEDEWRFYVDPVMSLVISVIILFTTIPLLRRASKILLQGPPPNVDISQLKEQISQVPGVISCHDLHVWQLSGNCTIATVHVVLFRDSNFTEIAKKFKKIFHKVDIHSTTIQPEISVVLSENDYSPNDESHSLVSKSSRQDHRAFNAVLSSEASGRNESDAQCLLQCLSQDCFPRMCCDGVKNKKFISDSKPEPYAECNDNEGYCETEMPNSELTNVTIQT